MYWKCDKCGSEVFTIKQKRKKAGIYCQYCGKWKAWDEEPHCKIKVNEK